MAASPESRNTIRLGNSPPAAGSFSDSTYYMQEGATHISNDGNGETIADSVGRLRSESPVDRDTRNQAPGILDRRRSTRPTSIRVGGRGGKSVGPKIPIKVNGVASPTLESPIAFKSRQRPMSMINLRNEMRLNEDDITPGETSASETFEDATSRPDTPKSQGTPEKSSGSDNVGLGINGGGLTATPERLAVHKDGINEGSPTPNAANLNRIGNDEQEWYEGDEAALTGKFRQPSAEKVSTPSLAVELAGQDLSRSTTPDLSSATPSRSQSHSRQPTLDGATTLVEGTAEQPEISLREMRSRLQSHSRHATAESVPSLQPPEHDSDRTVSPNKRLNRRSVRYSQTTLEPLRSVTGDSADRSVSPSKRLESQLSPGSESSSRSVSPARPQSPPKSGEPGAKRPSATDRIRAREEQGFGARPNSPPEQGGLARTASTRIAGFLGRMGSMRKPGRPPPAPTQAGFNTERRNTAHSIASVASGRGENLATIADSAEGMDSVHGYRPSLKDQFQTLRRQEELNFPGADSLAVPGEEENNPLSRTTSDAGIELPQSPDRESPDSKRSRSFSTTSGLKSPPLNPSLPPGTASGLSAGPAEEPHPVDWDLWQAVVYEGPSAVARTSGDELSRAIASGIPPAIRGVVWQVLAESKSEELEEIYRTLKARGTAATEQQQIQQTPRPLPSPLREESQSVLYDATEHSEVSSSRSSVHSGHSTPATSNMASPPPSIQGDDTETKAKLNAEKAKREAAALTKLERAIKRDLGSRTSFSKYTQAAGLQDGLFGLCKAYALFDEGVGYAQGINFIAMPLLFNMSEEEAFTLLVRLMNKYDVRSLFIGNLAGLHLRLYQFERLLEDYDPALYCHLRRRNVAPQLYATQWFLTLFAYRFPLQLVLRVYDLIFSEGLTAIMKFALALMQHNRDTLLGMKDMAQLTNFLKEKLFDAYIDKSPSASSLLDSGFFGSVTGGADKELYRADEMVRDACEITVSDATLAAYTSEWEESQTQTKSRDAELEHLRTANTSLTSRIKALEDRTQAQDTEHVTIAGDVVRIKVENDRLEDENEGLKMKIEELQKVVDAQPVEVENRLREEMDRILQRNSEVQSENRVLKEEQEEMEQELVNVKMKHAQTQSDFDALMQKWANVQAMLSDK